ncbi:MAG: DNA helicase RecQ [Alphaproteobacteria bacterium]|nr:DNA helicase RecQ [Alphaproteobacteria bacterium]
MTDLQEPLSEFDVAPVTGPGKGEVLHRTFGFDGFRPGQEPVVDCLLEGRNALVIMPTGAGKSLCFQVPALVRGGLTVVVSPLVALMQNQVAALRLAGVAAASINSSRDRDDNVATWRAVAAGEITLLYLSPERLMTERMLAALARLPLSMIVVDEVHCISQWGHSFRPEYEALTTLRDIFPGVPLAGFTATADMVTREDIASRLFGDRVETFIAGFDRPNIRLAVTSKNNARQQLLSFAAEREGQCGIVYCLSRRKTEEMAAALVDAGHNAFAYHAGLESHDRRVLLDRFLTEPGIVMTATIAFGMGIDKPDVRYVVHVDLPATVEAYYQELGRAGRDGEPADAAMFYGLDDIRMRRHFIEESEAEEARKRIDHRRLDALLAYCEAVECRRISLLNYFGESSGPCGNCDICLDPPTMVDGTQAAKHAVEAVLQTGERFGVVHIVDVLTAKATDKVAQFGHGDLPAYGQGVDTKPAVWRSILRQLVASHILEVDVAGYGGLRTTPRGNAIQRGEETIELREESLKSTARTKSKRGSAAQKAVAQGDLGLLQALKDLRLSLARERGVPPYVVFHDATLIELAASKPANQEEFGHIHGVGASKLKRFADPFLELIAQHR